MRLEDRMLTALKLLRDKAPRLIISSVSGTRDGVRYTFRRGCGICHNVVDNIGSAAEAHEARRVLRNIISTWDKCQRDRSGVPKSAYPVDDDEYGGYCQASRDGELWHNPLRLELLDYIIGELENGC